MKEAKKKEIKARAVFRNAMNIALQEKYSGSRFYVQASFTVEISYIMAFFLFALVTLIGFVYRLHGRVIAEYITHYSSVRASHIEKIFEKDGLDMERVKSAANEHIHKIGILSGSRVEVEKNLFSSISETSIYGENFSVKKGVNDPENFMRMITIVEGIRDGMEEAKKAQKP